MNIIDSFQKYISFFQLGDQYGSVSALALNSDCTRLLAGFAKGQICLFDLTSSKLLQTIADAHTPFTAVLHLKVRFPLLMWTG